jgi:hypothetical protein
MQMEGKHAGGRPPKFKTAQDLHDAVSGYWEYIKGEKIKVRNEAGDEIGEEYSRYPEHASISGLADYLGFESRQSMYDYEKKSKFSYIIKRAKLKVEASYEQRLNSNSPTGAIFALKNMGWKDKTEQEITVPQGLKITYNSQPGNEPLNDAD